MLAAGCIPTQRRGTHALLKRTPTCALNCEMGVLYSILDFSVLGVNCKGITFRDVGNNAIVCSEKYRYVLNFSPKNQTPR